MGDDSAFFVTIHGPLDRDSNAFWAVIVSVYCISGMIVL